MTHQPPQLIDPWIDRIIDQRYRIVERIGQGGMGVIYRVEHVRMGKIAALKLLHQSLSTNQSLMRRFQQEAEAISRLNHPNIVQVFDFGHVDDTPFLVMEYLSGVTLKLRFLISYSVFKFMHCLNLIIRINFLYFGI